MERKLIIANWKSNKTIEEAKAFLNVFKEKLNSLDLSNKEIIIAAPFTCLATLNYFIKEENLPIKLSGQNVSAFPEGAYTGEISARQIKEIADYVIVGHSERKRYLHEGENEILNKIEEAKKEGLQVILCVQDSQSPIYDKADIVAYEPPSAISTFGIGKAEDAKDVGKVIKELLSKSPNKKYLYGGSVNKSDVVSYAKVANCSGFLVGGASLDPQSFVDLLLQW